MPDFARHADAAVQDGLLLGLLISIALYQMLAFILTRHRSELWCSVYVALAVLLLVSHFGYGFHYLWPRTPALDRLVAFLLPSLMAVAGILLSISFLELRQHHPRLLPYLYGYCGLLLALAAARLVHGHPTVPGVDPALDAGMVLIVLGLVCQILLAFGAGRHDRSALIYCAAWAVYLAAVLCSGVDLHGIGQDNRIYRAGLSLQGLLLALALVSRIVVRSEQHRQSAALGSTQVALLEQAGRHLGGSLHAIRLLASLPAHGIRPQHLQFIERIARRLLHCLGSTDDEVALLRGQFATAEVEFELPVMVRQVLEGIVPIAPPAPMLYAVVDQRLPLWVIGDPQRLHRLLAGLLEQAVYTAGADGVALRFCMGGDPAGQHASMIISLRAPRAAELRDENFRRLVVALGGDSGIRGGNAELWLRLPLRPVSCPPAPPAQSLPRSRILLVHRNRTYRRALASVLCAQGYLVNAVASGPQAVECIEASQRGDQRYDWLIAQPGPDDWTAVRTLAEIRRRWPHAALRMLELMEPGQQASVAATERPLLCNDVAALLCPIPSEMLHRYPSLYPAPSSPARVPSPDPLYGMRVLVAAADRDLRTALAMVLEEQGCRADQEDIGRALEYRYRRGRRDDTAEFDALILCGAAALAIEVHRLRRFERRRRYAPVPVFIVADTTVDAGAEKSLCRAGADGVLQQPVTVDRLIRALTAVGARSPGL